MDGLQVADMVEKQAFIDGYAAARKTYLRRERERQILAAADYITYRKHSQTAAKWDVQGKQTERG